jgi:hypothetical protein
MAERPLGKNGEKWYRFYSCIFPLSGTMVSAAMNRSLLFVIALAGWCVSLFVRRITPIFP